MSAILTISAILATILGIIATIFYASNKIIAITLFFFLFIIPIADLCIYWYVHVTEKDKIQQQIKQSMGEADSLADKGQYEEAISVYLDTLKTIAPGKDIRAYAKANMNAGIAYLELSNKHQKEINIDKAIDCLQKSESACHDMKDNVNLAICYSNLGEAYFRLSEIRNAKKNLTKSIELNKQSLKVFNPKQFQKDYVESLNRLGNAYSALADIEDSMSYLEKAKECFEEAIKYHNRFSGDFLYCKLNNSQGIVFIKLSEKENDHELRLQYIDKSINLLKPCLGILDLNKGGQVSELFANISQNLGLAHQNKSEIVEKDKKANQIKEAIRYYDSALSVFSLELYPYKFGQINNNVGNCYSRIYYIEHKDIDITLGIKSFKKALSVFSDLKRWPNDFATIHLNLGILHMQKYIKSGDINDFNNALSSYNNALYVFKPNTHKIPYVTALYDRAVLYKNASKNMDALLNLEKAKRDVQNALKVINKDDSPRYYTLCVNELNQLERAIATINVTN